MVNNPYGLRIATPADGEALMGFVLPILSEDAAQAISPPKVEALVERCLRRDRALAAIVTGADGSIESSVGATVDTFDYTDQPHVMVRWLGVARAFRRSDRASRMVGYVHWLYDTMQLHSDVPIPVFIETLTTHEQRSKVLLYQRRLPQVGVLHALGCLPDRTFFNPGRVGQKEGGARASMEGPSLVPSPSSATAG